MRQSKRRVVAVVGSGLLAAMAPVKVPAAEQVATTSPWVEAQAARVRLVAGADAAHPGQTFLAGVEILLAEGWKTYWRHPGEAGVPPNFDWSGSVNTASIKVRYPAPIRLVDPAAEMIGYKKSVLFPIEVVPHTASEAVDLRLALEFAVCREICIPAQATLQLALPAALLKELPAPLIAAAQDRVPRAQTARHAGDPQLLAVKASLEGPAPFLQIEAKFADGAAGADVFIEAPEGLFVPMAQKLPGGSDGHVRFLVDLSRGGEAQELKGKALTITLVSDSGASEVDWPLRE
jgi:DsbC/DsbD-like thiol-disulfide interchange protein